MAWTWSILLKDEVYGLLKLPMIALGIGGKVSSCGIDFELIFVIKLAKVICFHFGMTYSYQMEALLQQYWAVGTGFLLSP